LHIDSGMHRLGLIKSEVDQLVTTYKHVLNIINISYIASHLCISENQAHEMNMKQLNEFNRYRELFPNAKVNFNN
jgi:alanine racemase